MMLCLHEGDHIVPRSCVVTHANLQRPPVCVPAENGGNEKSKCYSLQISSLSY